MKLPSLALCSLLFVASCSFPGGSRTFVSDSENVLVAGEVCEFVVRRTETNTINGISAFDEGELTCGMQTYDCGQSGVTACADKVARGVVTRRAIAG